MKRYVSEIFEEPKQWGLRADPLLWDYLKEYYNKVELPYDKNELSDIVLKTFKQFTGELPEEDGRYFVEKFAGDHGGISNGYLSGEFWLKRGLPMLLSRLEETNKEYLDKNKK